MLNSRYAPVVALAVLGIVLVAVIGWFVGVKPQLDSASDLRSQEDAIRANVESVEAAASRLDEYAAALDADTTIAEAIGLHAPSRLDLPGFRTRLSQAIVDSDLELVSLNSGNGVRVTGWEADSASLVSNAVAGLFSQGPVAASEDPNSAQSTWAPAVTASAETTAVSGDIRMVIFELQVAGSPEETYEFLKAMQVTDDQLFQVYDVNLESRPSGASSINGVADPDDGDVLTTITAALYVHNPDTAVLDEVETSDGEPIDDAFEPIEDVDEQPGG